MSDPVEVLARELDKAFQKAPLVQHPTIGCGFLALARYVLERYVERDVALDKLIAGLQGERDSLVAVVDDLMSERDELRRSLSATER